jgi:hypothetical protein
MSKLTQYKFWNLKTIEGVSEHYYLLLIIIYNYEKLLPARSYFIKFDYLEVQVQLRVFLNNFDSLRIFSFHK